MKNNCLICSLLFASGIQNAWGTQITDRKANPDQAQLPQPGGFADR